MSANASACDRCRGLFEPLSRQASQNAMGPWYIRDEANPFLPGCSIQTLRGLVARGRVTRDTVLRGPTTRQFWMYARNTPGVANLLGECHACHADAAPDARQCESCGASFAVPEDRERLGLSDVRLLPGHAAPEMIASAHGPGAANRDGEAARTPSPPAPRVTPGPSVDAAAMIAARHRQRRQGRRRTIMGALLAVVIVGVAAAGAVVYFRDDLFPRPAASAPAPSPSQAQPPTREATPLPTPAPTPPAEPLPAEDARGDTGGATDADVARLLLALESGDLARMDDALRAIEAAPPGSAIRTDSWLVGAATATAARVRVIRAGQRL